MPILMLQRRKARNRKLTVKYRDATIDDIPVLWPMFQAIHRGGAYKKFFKGPHEQSVKETMETLIKDKNGMLFVAEVKKEIVGMAGAAILPWYFNHHLNMCQHLFWYVKPEHRNQGHATKFIGKMEYRARMRECTTMMLMALNYNPSRYSSRGFEPTEHYYMKVLEQ